MADTLTNREFLSNLVHFFVYVVDESANYPRLMWDDYSGNLDSPIDDFSESSGVCTVYTSRGAVMDVEYFCAAGDETDEDYFEIRRRSDVGFTETIRISIAHALKLRKMYRMGYINKYNALAMMRGAILIAQ